MEPPQKKQKSVIPSLVEIAKGTVIECLPEELINLLAIEAIGKRRRDAWLIFSHDRDIQEGICSRIGPLASLNGSCLLPVFFTEASYNKVTLRELPFLIMKDERLGKKKGSRLFQWLLDRWYHSSVKKWEWDSSGKNLERKEDVWPETDPPLDPQKYQKLKSLVTEDDDDWWNRNDIESEIIVWLYTQVYKPEDILDHISNAGSCLNEGEQWWAIIFRDSHAGKLLENSHARLKMSFAEYLKREDRANLRKKVPVIQLSKDGSKEIDRFDSLQDAHEATRVETYKIFMGCQSAHIIDGYRWKFQ